MKVKAQGHDGEAGELANPTCRGGGDLNDTSGRYFGGWKSRGARHVYTWRCTLVPRGGARVRYLPQGRGRDARAVTGTAHGSSLWKVHP